MGYQESLYPESRFGGFTDVDGTIAFYGRINALIEPSFTVLDAGCGRGAQAEDEIPFRRGLLQFKGKVDKVIGIDPDRKAESNPLLNEFRPITGDEWPIESDSIDLIYSDCVLEHVPDPDRFFSEARRVLRDGGYLCIRTPNRWSYIALLSRLIPNRYHAGITSKVQERRKGEDVFPTLYRCNSAGAIRRQMRRYGFHGIAYGYEAEPRYLQFSKVAYFLGFLHQRLAPGFVKPSLFAFGRLRKDSE